MPANLEGKVAVVTGASRGLGQRVALRLAAAGADVAVVARGQAALDSTAQQISALGVRAAVFASDLGKLDASGSETLKSAVERQLGTPSILVNGAGIFGPIRPFKDVDPVAWLETLAINTISPILLTRAFVGGMIDGGWGRVISFTSAASLHHPGPLNSAYATSKVALNQFTRHIAAELEGTGVTANVIHPGDVKTEMWADIRDDALALGAQAEAYLQWVRWVEETGGDDPEKAADLVLDLTGDAAAGVNGQFLWIKDGLQAPIPSWGEPTSTQPWRE
jgi:NAD(P)-dependent dehydrogenase (short-subunit alcohol dehydrogenase family)